MDLAAWYAAGRWVGLLDLIDALPMASRVREAAYNDPEDAALLAQLPEPEGVWYPPVSEFGLLEQLISDLIDEQKLTRMQLVRTLGGKPNNEKPTARPVTLAGQLRKEVREREEREWTVEFISLLGFSEDDI